MNDKFEVPEKIKGNGPNSFLSVYNKRTEYTQGRCSICQNNLKKGVYVVHMGLAEMHVHCFVLSSKKLNEQIKRYSKYITRAKEGAFVESL